MATTNGKTTATVKRLLAVEAGLRDVKTEVAGVSTRLEVMTELLMAQGETLRATRTCSAPRSRSGRSSTRSRTA